MDMMDVNKVEDEELICVEELYDRYGIVDCNISITRVEDENLRSVSEQLQSDDDGNGQHQPRRSMRSRKSTQTKPEDTQYYPTSEDDSEDDDEGEDVYVKEEEMEEASLNDTAEGNPKKKRRRSKKTNDESANETELKSYPCTLCTEIYTSLAGFRRHLKEAHQRKGLPCPYCLFTFPSPDQLAQHKLKKHGDSGDGEATKKITIDWSYDDIICHYCGLKFNSLKEYRLHKKMHFIKNQSHQCRLCGKVLKAFEILRQHFEYIHLGIPRKHEQEKRLAKIQEKGLIVPDLMLKRGKKLTQHLSCDICGKRFYQQWRLLEHNILKHKQADSSGKVSLSCGVCGKLCINEYRYNIHVRSHSKRKAFICDYCGKGYKRSCDFRAHIKKQHPEQYCTLPRRLTYGRDDIEGLPSFEGNTTEQLPIFSEPNSPLAHGDSHFDDGFVAESPFEQVIVGPGGNALKQETGILDRFYNEASPLQFNNEDDTDYFGMNSTPTESKDDKYSSLIDKELVIDIEKVNVKPFLMMEEPSRVLPKKRKQSTWIRCRMDGCRHKAKDHEEFRKHRAEVHNRGVRVFEFKCDIAGCTYRSRYEVSLISHRLTHFKSTAAKNTSTSSYQCFIEGCEKGFSKRGYLTKHMKTIHKMEDSEVIDHLKKQYEDTITEEPEPSQVVQKKILPQYFKCDFPGCTYRARYTISMKSHQMTHETESDTKKSKSAPYPCYMEGCKAAYHKRDQLAKHIENMHQSRFGSKRSNTSVNRPKSNNLSYTWSCDVEGCSFRAKYKLSLDSHKIAHKLNESINEESKPRINHCIVDGCGKTYHKIHELARHLEIIHKLVQPEFRQKIKSRVQRKRNTAVNTSNEGPFKCSICDKEFRSKWYRRRHIQLKHENGKLPSWQCPLCPKPYSMKWILLNHYEKEHPDGPRFPCTYCGHSFTVKGEVELQRHMKRHDKARVQSLPFRCVMSNCTKDLGDHEKLRQHVTQDHRQGFKSGNVLCITCGKEVSKWSIRTHERRHLGIGPKHLCKYCGNSFELNSRLQTHLEAKHPQEFDGQSKSFVCELCGSAYWTSFSYKKHIYFTHIRADIPRVKYSRSKKPKLNPDGSVVIKRRRRRKKSEITAEAEYNQNQGVIQGNASIPLLTPRPVNPAQYCVDYTVNNYYNHNNYYNY